MADTFSVIENAVANPDPIEAVKSLCELMRDAYWKQKDLTSAVACGRAAAQHGLTGSLKVDPGTAIVLRGLAKAACYDLASFTWPGWNEPEIIITPSDCAVGLDAAIANLRLAEELERSDLPMSRAYWVLGAQQMSAHDLVAATDNFQQAAELAERAGEEGEALLYKGYACVAVTLLNPRRPVDTDPLNEIKVLLRPFLEGRDYMQQLRTACAVFSRQLEF